MKTIKFLLFFLAMGFMVVACGDDDPNDGNVDCNDSNSLYSEIADEAQTFSDALTAWVNDPTNTGLCNDFKDAAQEYLNALKALEDCADDAGVGATWRQDIAEAEQALADLTC